MSVRTRAFADKSFKEFVDDAQIMHDIQVGDKLSWRNNHPIVYKKGFAQSLYRSLRGGSNCSEDSIRTLEWVSALILTLDQPDIRELYKPFFKSSVVASLDYLADTYNEKIRQNSLSARTIDVYRVAAKRFQRAANMLYDHLEPAKRAQALSARQEEHRDGNPLPASAIPRPASREENGMVRSAISDSGVATALTTVVRADAVPPPAPPLPSPVPPPPPAPPLSSTHVIPSAPAARPGMGSLLSAIQARPQLRSAAQRNTPPRPRGGIEDSLAAIRTRAFQLRSAADRDAPPPPVSSGSNGGGLDFSALTRAAQARQGNSAETIDQRLARQRAQRAAEPPPENPTTQAELFHSVLFHRRCAVAGRLGTVSAPTPTSVSEEDSDWSADSD